MTHGRNRGGKFIAIFSFGLSLVGIIPAILAREPEVRYPSIAIITISFLFGLWSAWKWCHSKSDQRADEKISQLLIDWDEDRRDDGLKLLDQRGKEDRIRLSVKAALESVRFEHYPSILTNLLNYWSRFLENTWLRELLAKIEETRDADIQIKLLDGIKTACFSQNIESWLSIQIRRIIQESKRKLKADRLRAIKLAGVLAGELWDDLIQVFKDDVEPLEIRMAAVHSLGETKRPDSVEHFIKIFDSKIKPDPRLQDEIWQAVEKIGQNLDYFCRNIAPSKKVIIEIRGNAINCLIADDIACLCDLLSDDDSRIRVQAARRLGELGENAVVASEKLAYVVEKDSEIDPRINAIWALGQTKSQKAADLLRKLQSKPDISGNLSLNEAIQRALAEIE